MGNVVYICTDGQCQGPGDLRQTESEVGAILQLRKSPLTTLLRQVKTVGLGGDVLSHGGIVLAPLATRPFNPDGISEAQRWDENGTAVGWTDSSLETTKHALRPAVHEGRDDLFDGRFTTRKHHGALHSTGRMHERGMLVNPLDPRQHLRTRSLSIFPGDTTVDSDTSR